MKSFLTLFHSCLFLLGLIACGRSSSELKVVNGQNPQELVKQSTVSLIQNDTNLSFCSGTLIAKQLVLTAAHCVTDKVVSDLQVRLSSGQTFAVIEVRAFKPEQKYGVNFDVAWVKLESEVPDEFTPLELLRDPSSLSGVDVILAGYGQTKSQCGVGALSCATGQLLEVSAKVSEYLDHGRWHKLLLTQSLSNGGPCLGDSGGPLFLMRDSKLYVGGNFVGWDKRLVPEQASKICDSGRAIYNAAGPYFDWIESTSGLKLLYHPEHNPVLQSENAFDFTGDPKSFQDWCAYRNADDAAWYTVQRLVSLAGDYALENGGDIRRIFDDCAYAEENLLAKIKAEKGLDLDAFAPDSFGPKAQITDLRPLLSIDSALMTRLTLTGHAISDYSPLTALFKLRKLEIIDDLSPVASALDASRFNILETLTVRNSPGSVDFKSLSTMKSLRNLEITKDTIPSALNWGALLIRNLSLDDVRAEGTIDLDIPKLNVLKIHASVDVSLPSTLNDLQNLDLKDLSGLSLPRIMPKLRNLKVSDCQQGLRLTGAWRFEDLTALETIEFTGNKGIEDFSLLPNLSRLRSINLSRNDFRSIDDLTGHSKLAALDISGNRLETLPYLEGLPLLQTLDASRNLLRDAQGMEAATSIIDLDLSDNPLADLGGFGQLARLKKLRLEGIREGSLDSLEGLGELPMLEELRVGRNSFRSVKDFLRFPKLQVLVISDNQIQDIAKLKALTALDYLEAVNNPLLQKTCPLRNPKYCRFDWANSSP